MHKNIKRMKLEALIESINFLEYKINEIPKDEIYIHQNFKSLKNTVKHTYNQLEFGKDYLFKKKSLDIISLKDDINLINNAFEIEKNNPTLNFFEVNKLAKEKTFGQELKESLEESDVIYFDRLKRTFKND